ncbi:hypothetical protein N0V90_012912 [Kalmusia sp. IMI 367209]|nr:hypothetical protein N0V90_012912 [Kalmusia sp. IMI 367209]
MYTRKDGEGLGRLFSQFYGEEVFDFVNNNNGIHLSTRTPYPSPLLKATAHFELGSSPPYLDILEKAESTTVATCKTCRKPIQSTLGICEGCKKTVVLSSLPGKDTPTLAAVPRNFGSTDLLKLAKNSSTANTPGASTSPKRNSGLSSAQLIDPPMRISSLRPPPPQQCIAQSPTDAPHSRKASLTDAKESLLRLQIARKPVPPPPAHPTSPTTPPSTSHSYSSTTKARPSSLANITTPPSTAKYRYARHTSATPSELSTMFPYIASSTTTSPPSVCRASYQLQNTISAWEDSDSEDEEKVGLVGYWKARKWRGSRGSLGGHSSQARRDSAGNDDDEGRARFSGGRKVRSFVRVISCGCNEN